MPEERYGGRGSYDRDWERSRKERISRSEGRYESDEPYYGRSEYERGGWGRGEPTRGGEYQGGGYGQQGYGRSAEFGGGYGSQQDYGRSTEFGGGYGTQQGYGRSDELGGGYGWQQSYGRGSEFGGGYGWQPGYGRAREFGAGYGRGSEFRGDVERGGYFYGRQDRTVGEAYGPEGETYGIGGETFRTQRWGRGRGMRGKGPKGFQRSDERIRELVSEALEQDDYIDASNIEVTVSSGEVTLSGTVDDRDEKRRAEDVVDDVAGVRNVQNQLRLSRGAQWGEAGTSPSRRETAATSRTESESRPRR